MTVTILAGDCRDILPTLPDKSIHCCVTSPPYFGLRDYGTSTWQGGDKSCDHQPGQDWFDHHFSNSSTVDGGKNNQEASAKRRWYGPDGGCTRCGAKPVDRQIGLEPTPDEFVAEMVAVFREVRRVLRDDGTLWLNLGDSYAGGGNYRGVNSEASLSAKQRSNGGARGVSPLLGARNTPGVKSKDLIGVPWAIAFALRADGWYLRQDIIWSKPNPMPESVTDRCTKAHEYIFLMSKSARYFFDADTIAEMANYSGLLNQDDSGFKSPQSFNGKHKAGYRSSGNKARKPASARGVPVDTGGKTNGAVAGSVPWTGNSRNKRSVWTVATAPFSEAHFATFPPALIEPCIKAGCPEGGTVLDPFGGAGTTGLVADRLRREAILIELNPDYAAMARRRLIGDAGMFAEVQTAAEQAP